MKKLIALAAALCSTTAFAAGAASVKQCHGNEPFWDLSISSSKISLGILGELKMSMDKRPAATALGTTNEYIALYQGRLNQDPSRFMNVIIKKAECTDHMSEEVYPYTVLVLSGNTLFEGCCRE